MSSRVEKKASAREKAAEMRAQQARAERRRRVAFAGGAVVLVVVIVVALVIVKLTSSGSKAVAGQASGSLIKSLADVPASVVDQVGAGTAQNPPKAISGAPSSSGKPQILYVGGEFCPYCAAERWAVAVTLERFGDFGKLRTTQSSSQDVYPSTPTLSFHGSTYTSDSIDFTGKEVFGATQQTPLDKLSSSEQAIETKFNSDKSIPFVYIAGRYVSSGATYDPGLLAGKTQAEVAKALQDPDDPITKAVVGSANVFTAAICKATGDKPSAVCSASGVTKAAAKLGGS